VQLWFQGCLEIRSPPPLPPPPRQHFSCSVLHGESPQLLRAGTGSQGWGVPGRAPQPCCTSGHPWTHHPAHAQKSEAKGNAAAQMGAGPGSGPLDLYQVICIYCKSILWVFPPPPLLMHYFVLNYVSFKGFFCTLIS